MMFTPGRAPGGISHALVLDALFLFAPEWERMRRCAPA